MVSAILLIVALVLFVLASANVSSPRVGLLPAGLAFVTLALLVMVLGPIV